MVKTIVLLLLKIAAIVIATTSIVYFSLRLASGDPELARRGIVRSTQQADGAQQPDDISAPRTAFGALLRAYPHWLKELLLFRFAPSYYSSLRPGQLIRPQIGRTALLAVASFALSVLCATGLSVVHARRPGRVTGTLLNIGSRIFITIPEFWLAMILLFCFAIYIPIFPLFGADSIVHYILPLAALVISRGAVMFSVLDSEMRRQREQEYVLSARVRNISPRRIAYRYQLRNALTTLIPIGVIQFGYLFGGAVIIEQVFGISGFGTLLLQALQRRDYPVAEAGVYLVALIFAVLGIVADVVRVIGDPRLRSASH